jgi:hypothetical protein
MGLRPHPNRDPKTMRPADEGGTQVVNRAEI